jgi:hypothetical protein
MMAKCRTRRLDSVVMLILIQATTWLAPFSNFEAALSCYS